MELNRRHANFEGSGQMRLTSNLNVYIQKESTTGIRQTADDRHRTVIQAFPKLRRRARTTSAGGAGVRGESVHVGVAMPDTHRLRLLEWGVAPS